MRKTMRIKEVDKMIEEVRKIQTPYTMQCSDLELRIFESVYPPGEESIMLAKNMIEGEYSVKQGDWVLDYGTGSGFLAMIAAQKGANVIATDINPQAIDCALINFALLSKYNKGYIFQPRLGNGFSPIKKEEKFDTILASLPYDDAVPNDLIEHSFYDKNFAMRKELFENAKNHLSPDGKILFTYSQKAQERNPIENFCKGYYIIKIDEVASKNDVYYLLQIKPL
jgi:release factor glutamine methyltransferase